LYQLHVDDCDPAAAVGIRDELEKLVEEGKVRWYGWSTDDPERAEVFAAGPHCAAVQHMLNMGWDAPEMLSLCEKHDLASVNRSPLGMGMMTGKFSPETTFPKDDLRHGWDLKTGVYGPKNLRFLAQVKELLSAAGDTRTPTQAALTWILSRSPRTVPIPGFKTAKQTEENARVLDLEVFSKEIMDGIERIFERKGTS